MKITKSQLKEIIREEVSRLKKQYILEDKKKAIVNELRILNEDEDNGQLEALLAKRDAEFYKWFDSVNIPRYQDYAGVQNLSSNTILGNEFNDYAQHIRNSVDKRDWGMKYGDAVMSYLKDRYMNKINSIGDARVREFLKNPKVTDFNSNEEHVKQSIEANKFIDSIPSISDSKYLGGDASFSKISSAVDDMIEECIDRGYTHLIPIILPWFASSWKRNVIDNIGRLVKDDAVVTQELFGIGKKKKEAAAKAAEEEEKAAEEKKQKDADHKAIADQVYTVEKSIEMDADLRNSGQEGGYPEKYYDSLHKKIKELKDSFKSKYGQEAEEYKSLKTQ